MQICGDEEKAEPLRDQGLFCV